MNSKLDAYYERMLLAQLAYYDVVNNSLKDSTDMGATFSGDVYPAFNPDVANEIVDSVVGKYKFVAQYGHGIASGFSGLLVREIGTDNYVLGSQRGQGGFVKYKSYCVCRVSIVNMFCKTDSNSFCYTALLLSMRKRWLAVVLRKIVRTPPGPMRECISTSVYRCDQSRKATTRQ